MDGWMDGAFFFRGSGLDGRTDGWRRKEGRSIFLSLYALSLNGPPPPPTAVASEFFLVCM